MPLWLQLYVSVDAATKESLKAVDRPLFSDFWERFLVDMQKYLQMHIIKLWLTNTNCIVLYYLLRCCTRILSSPCMRKIKGQCTD